MTATLPRVLIVDDEPTIRSTARICLEDAGYAVDQATNGADALEQIEFAPPDLVLLDLAMPVIDGMSVLAEICTILRAKTKVVVVTANASVKSAVEAMQLGALDVLEKPFTPETLRSRVAATLARRELPDDSPAADSAIAFEVTEIDDAGLASETGYGKGLNAVRRHLAASRVDAAAELLNRIGTAHRDRVATDPAFLNLAGVICEAQGHLLRARSFYAPAVLVDGVRSYQPAVDNKWRIYDILGDAASNIDVALGDAEELKEAFPEGVPPSPLSHLKSARLTGNWDQ